MLALSVLILIYGVDAQSTYVENVNISLSVVTMLTNGHNAERNQYCVGNLTYNGTLAAIAQSRAQTCEFGNSGELGMNVFMATFAYVRIQTALSVWLSERANFDCASDNPPDIPNRDYIQMVNNATKEFGCAAAKCKISIGMYATYMLYVVCVYDKRINGEPFDKRFCTAYSDCRYVGVTSTTPPTTPTTTQPNTQLTSTSTLSSSKQTTVISGQSTVTNSGTEPSMLSSGTTLTPTTPLTTLMMQTTPLTTPTTTMASIASNGCIKLRDLCHKKCGLSTIFPFLEQCMTGFDGLVLQCTSPPDCVCDVPVELQSYGSSIQSCKLSTCNNAFEGTNPGSLGWCKSCGYNCGGYQADCIKNNQFCITPARCSRLNMCEEWRQQHCTGPSDIKCTEDSVANAITDGTLVVSASEHTSYGAALGWMVAFISLCVATAVCVFVGVMCHRRIIDSYEMQINRGQDRNARESNSSDRHSRMNSARNSATNSPRGSNDRERRNPVDAFISDV